MSRQAILAMQTKIFKYLHALKSLPLKACRRSLLCLIKALQLNMYCTVFKMSVINESRLSVAFAFFEAHVSAIMSYIKTNSTGRVRNAAFTHAGLTTRYRRESL